MACFFARSAATERSTNTPKEKPCLDGTTGATGARVDGGIAQYFARDARSALDEKAAKLIQDKLLNAEQIRTELYAEEPEARRALASLLATKRFEVLFAGACKYASWTDHEIWVLIGKG